MKKLLQSFVMFLFPIVLLSQPGERLGAPPPMERLENYKKVRMLEEMKLDEPTGIKLISRYSAHRETLKALEESRFRLIEKLKSELGSDASNADYQKIFDQLTELEKSITDSKIKFVTDFKEILTTKQIAQYLVFEMNFAKDIRDILRESHKRDRSRE